MLGEVNRVLPAVVVGKGYSRSVGAVGDAAGDNARTATFEAARNSMAGFRIRCGKADGAFFVLGKFEFIRGWNPSITCRGLPFK